MTAQQKQDATVAEWIREKMREVDGAMEAKLEPTMFDRIDEYVAQRMEQLSNCRYSPEMLKNVIQAATCAGCKFGLEEGQKSTAALSLNYRHQRRSVANP